VSGATPDRITVRGGFGGRIALTGLIVSSVGAAAAAPHDIVIDGVHVFPESITSARDGTVFAGSLPGTIYRARPGSSSATAWVEHNPQNGLMSILGVLADDRSQSLWVCTAPTSLPGGVSGGASALVRLNLSTGAPRAIYPLPAPKAACDDIALQRDGTAFVVDIANGEIDVLRKGASALVRFAQEDSLKGIDGIAFAADGTLYVDNIRTSALLRVDRDAQGAYRGLTVLTTSEPIKGPDGLRPLSGNRFVLAEGRAGRIDEVTILGDRAMIRVLRTALDSPSSVTVVGRVVYAPDGKSEYLMDPKLKDQHPEPFVIHAIDLPRPQ